MHVGLYIAFFFGQLVLMDTLSVKHELCGGCLVVADLYATVLR